MRPNPPPFRKDDSDPPVTGVTPVEIMTGEDENDTRILRDASKEAEEYLRSFAWCGNILRRYFGGGVGGIFAVFLFNILPTQDEVSPWIWIVVGDIPPAYLPLEDCKSPAEVFNTYIGGMTTWVEMAREGRSGTADDGVPPVNVPPTPEWSEKLEKRLHSLILIASPFFEDADKSERVN